ncbi:MAG: polysaccharide pyruvyl transferase family protein [Candidatus Omnitrophota bacterium]
MALKSKARKVFVSCVPYRSDMAGNEAVLSNTVDLIRDIDRSVEISARSVCSGAIFDEQAYSRGFQRPLKRANKRLIREILNNDIYVWAGSFTIREHPQFLPRVADMVKLSGRKLILFCCGMNSEDNFTGYKLRSPFRINTLNFMEKLTGTHIHLVKEYENRVSCKTAALIKRSLDKADLVLVRDKYTRDCLINTGIKVPVHTAADPVVMLRASGEKRVDDVWAENGLWTGGAPVIGVNLNLNTKARRAKIKELSCLLDSLVKKTGARILFIPVGPGIDTADLVSIRSGMKMEKEAAVLKDCLSPADIAGVISRTDLVICSDYHFMIFAGVAGTPVAGVSRGKETDDYLRSFGEKLICSIEELESDKVISYCEKLLLEGAAINEKTREVIAEMKNAVLKTRDLVSAVFEM